MEAFSRRQRAALQATAIVAFVLAGAASAAGRPPTPPPKVGGVFSSPPPAWVEAPDRSFWLAYGDYCWTQACVDFVPPAGRIDVPSLLVRSGTIVRIHLGFLPQRVIVGRFSSSTWTRLRPSRIVSWRVEQAGLFDVEADAHGLGSPTCCEFAFAHRAKAPTARAHGRATAPPLLLGPCASSPR